MLIILIPLSDVMLNIYERLFARNIFLFHIVNKILQDVMFLLLGHPRGSWNVSLIFLAKILLSSFSLCLCWSCNVYVMRIRIFCKNLPGHSCQIRSRIAQFSNEKLVSSHRYICPEHMRDSAHEPNPLKTVIETDPLLDPLCRWWEMVKMGVKSQWFMSHKWFNLRPLW